MTVHPKVFHDVLDPIAVTGWQVQQEPAALRVLLARPEKVLDVGSLSRDLERSLTAAGAPGQRVMVELVEEIPKTALGKAPLVKALDAQARVGKSPAAVPTLSPSAQSPDDT